MKEAEGKFNVIGEPRGENLFIWVSFINSYIHVHVHLKAVSILVHKIFICTYIHVYSQIWANDHLSIADICLLQPVLKVHAKMLINYVYNYWV